MVEILPRRKDMVVKELQDTIEWLKRLVQDLREANQVLQDQNEHLEELLREETE